jgi:hypothetical protein
LAFLFLAENFILMKRSESMQRCARWPRLLLWLVLLGCRDNSPATQPPQRNEVPEVQNLKRGYFALVTQFNADSAKVRMLLMLSPT